MEDDPVALEGNEGMGKFKFKIIYTLVLTKNTSQWLVNCPQYPWTREFRVSSQLRDLPQIYHHWKPMGTPTKQYA